MTDENNSDLTEALSLIAVSLGKISQTLASIDQNFVTMTKDQTSQLKDLTDCTEAIADAFYYVDGNAGSVYHLAGSMNSIKHSMPNYAPNPHSKFGDSNKKKRRSGHPSGKAQQAFEQPVDLNVLKRKT